MKCPQQSDMPGERVDLGTTTPNMTASTQSTTSSNEGFFLSILWLPYVLLSLLLVGLMLVSFVHYHRKHGHKYHQRQALAQMSRAQQLADNEALLNIPNEVKSHSAIPRQYADERHYQDMPQHKTRHHRHHHRNHSEPEEKASHNRPPNGQLKNSGQEPLITPAPAQRATAQPRQPRPSNPAKQHCDEPSTSSSTVSSKESKPGATTAASRAQNRRHRNREPIVYEANENGSMVDVRLKNQEVESREAAPQPKVQSSNRPSAPREGQSTGRKLPDIEALKRQSVQKSRRPNYLPQRNRTHNSREDAYSDIDHRPQYHGYHPTEQFYTHSQSLDYYDHRYVDYMEPVHYSPDYRQPYRQSSTYSLPHRGHPGPPRRDFYSVPFYPSGDMQMLSDNEGDEALLLQHTKL